MFRQLPAVQPDEPDPAVLLANTRTSPRRRSAALLLRQVDLHPAVVRVVSTFEFGYDR